MAYILDSDVFIGAKDRYYRYDICPGFWHWLDAANAAGTLMSIQAVRKELLGRGDWLSNWCKPRKAMFVDTKDGATYDSLGILATWVHDSYGPAYQSKFFASADFVLVGYAHAYGHTVVTHEVPKNCHDVKIPNACKQMAVPVINPFQMLADEEVKFDLRP
jgi:hypothetical protein